MSDTLNALLDQGVPTVKTGGLVRVNPLAAITAGNQAAQSEFETRNWQAKQAAGEAYQGAINKDGEFDSNKFRTLLSQSGPAALAAGAALTNTQQISSDQLNQAHKKLDWVNSTTGALTRLGPNISQQDVIGALHEGVTNDMLTAPEFEKRVAEVAALGNDPAKLHAYASQHQFTAMSTKEQLEQTYGTPFREDRGGQIVGGVQAPPRMGGGLSTGPGAIDTGMTPAQRGQIVTWEDPDGTKHTGTLEEAHKAMGITTPSGPAIGGGGGGGGGTAPSVTPPAPPPGTKVRGPGPTSTTPPGTPPPPAGGASITGPRPGTVEAARKTAEDSAAAGTALTARGDQAPSNKANYANMMSDLDRLGSMPPGAAKQVAIETFLRKATGYGLTMSADQVAAANSFSKLANIAIGQQLAAIGGTDARQNLFMGSSPNLDLSKLGNQQIIHMLQGNEDAIQAKSRAWNDWANEHGSGTYRQFQNDWNHHFDPRVFQQQYYQPDEVEALKKSLAREGKGATAKFWEDVDYAKANKMIP